MADEEAIRRDSRVELIAAVFLSIATLLTAWSAYQATRWSGDQSERYTTASALRTESVRAANIARNQLLIDVNTFIAWLDASVGGDQQLADDIQARMREEFRPAFDAWLTTAPAGELPDGTPFDGDAYALDEEERAEDLERQAAAAFDDGQEANQVSDNFVLAAVMLASVLFFAGIAGTLNSRTPQLLLITLAGVMLAAGAIVVVILPQDVGI